MYHALGCKVLSSLFYAHHQESYAVSFSCCLEFNNSLLDSLGSDDDSGNEDFLDMEYSEAEAEELKRNAEVMIWETRGRTLACFTGGKCLTKVLWLG